MVDKKLGRRAVVIGGSIAGLLGARVLSDDFDEVVIIEADRPWDEKEPRKRVPQGHHSHLLLESGQRVLERLFPGLTNELIENGSVVTDFVNDLEWFHFGKWKRRFLSGIKSVQQTRPFLEWHINKRLKEYTNIRIQYETLATGLILTPDQKRVKGVRIKNMADEELLADIVVDASGYGSQTLKWLAVDGAKIREEVKIGLFYATQFYRCDQLLEWKNLVVSAQLPHSPYGGVVLSFEDGKFGVTLSGYLKEPPKSSEDFLHIAQSLPVPHIYDFLQKAKPVGDFKIYRIPQQVRKRLDKIKLPSGIMIMGDAFCRLDPVYGQGMSVAALEAELLSQELDLIKTEKDWDIFYKGFHKKLYKVTKNPWNMTVTEAFRHPDIFGHKPIGAGLKQKFVSKIYKASATKEDIYLELVKVMQLTCTPNVFFRPTLWPKLFIKGKGRS